LIFFVYPGPRGSKKVEQRVLHYFLFDFFVCPCPEGSKKIKEVENFYNLFDFLFAPTLKGAKKSSSKVSNGFYLKNGILRI
jgi:hypothetical protein